MSNICDFDRILKTECNLQHFTRNCRINNLDDFEKDEVDAYLWREGLLNMKEKGMIICYIMSRYLVMFLRGEKVNVVKYWWNIVTRLKVNKCSLSKWLSNLKPKIFMLYQGNYFEASVKLSFWYRQTHCIDDQDKVQSVKGTDNEFPECQTPKKKPQSIGISPVSLHAFMTKMIWNRKWMTWLRCTRQCKKN